MWRNHEQRRGQQERGEIIKDILLIFHEYLDTCQDAAITKVLDVVHTDIFNRFKPSAPGNAIEDSEAATEKKLLGNLDRSLKLGKKLS